MNTPKNKIPVIGYARPIKNNTRLTNGFQSPSLQDEVANIKSQSTSNLIYNALMSEIAEDNSKYIKQLEKQCTQKRSQSHSRSQTIKTVGSSPFKHNYDNTRGTTTPTNSIKQYKTITPKATNSNIKLKSTQMLFSQNFEQFETQSNSKISRQLSPLPEQSRFISFLDNYVDSLTRQSSKQQKSFEQQDAAFKKLVAYEQKFKQMETRHQTQIRQFMKKQKLMKLKLQEMKEQVFDLTIRLKHEHQERKRYEHLFLEHEKQLKIRRYRIRDIETSSFSSKDYDFSMISSELDDEDSNFQNCRQTKFQKMSIRDSEGDLNTSQKISRFLRKPLKDVRSTNPGIELSDEEYL